MTERKTCRHAVVELDIPLPTWNTLLAGRVKDRMHCRHFVHQFVSVSRITVDGRSIQMGSPSKRRLMELSRSAYLQTIRTKRSRKPRSGLSELKAKVKNARPSNSNLSSRKEKT